MNVNVVQGSNNQVSLFTGTGQQLVGGTQASQLSFGNVGTLSATSLWSANPSQDARRHHHADFAVRHAPPT